MEPKRIPKVFEQLISEGCIERSDLKKTEDGFWMVYRSIADILARKDIFDFPDENGIRIPCSRFFDDWFLYAVPDGDYYAYSLVKLREQEHDTEDGDPADGDSPGVTVSFIAFAYEILLACLAQPSDQNRRRLDREINRVVTYGGQRHDKALKRYFVDPRSDGAYLVAATYARHIAKLAENGSLDVPEYYKDIVQRCVSFKSSAKLMRLPTAIESINQKAERTICDHEKIYFKDRENPDKQECRAILATHTGNTTLYSFAAEVEYHARFLFALAKIRIPYFGRSIYSSAIRADMTIGDNELQGNVPFYQDGSKIVKRQYALHKHQTWI